MRSRRRAPRCTRGWRAAPGPRTRPPRPWRFQTCRPRCAWPRRRRRSRCTRSRAPATSVARRSLGPCSRARAACLLGAPGLMPVCRLVSGSHADAKTFLASRAVTVCHRSPWLQTRSGDERCRCFHAQGGESPSYVEHSTRSASRASRLAQAADRAAQLAPHASSHGPHAPKPSVGWRTARAQGVRPHARRFAGRLGASHSTAAACLRRTRTASDRASLL